MMSYKIDILQGLERPKEPGLKSLRTVRELQEGMVSYDFFSYRNFYESSKNELYCLKLVIYLLWVSLD